MTTTFRAELPVLLERLNHATVLLRREPKGVPPAVIELVEQLDKALHADAPQRLDVDPYLSTQLFAAALRAAKALRADTPEAQRRQLRVALEQVRHTVRDLVEATPFSPDEPVRSVLAHLIDMAPVPQGDLAGLLGVSTRQLQRWVAGDAAPPPGVEARIRTVARLAAHLRHVFTAPGVIAWFTRPHPRLGVAPATLVDDAGRYQDLVAAAASARVSSAM